MYRFNLNKYMTKLDGRMEVDLVLGILKRETFSSICVWKCLNFHFLGHTHSLCGTLILDLESLLVRTLVSLSS